MDATDFHEMEHWIQLKESSKRPDKSTGNGADVKDLQQMDVRIKTI